VLRAIRWVFANDPSPADIISHGEKVVSVTLVIDGVEVERRHDNGTNMYRLGKEEYKAFGHTIPEPVANFLALSEVNYQNQYEPPFWLSQTAGFVSRELNKIVNLELIDSTLSNLASELRKQSIIISERESAVQRYRGERKQLSFVRELKDEFDRVNSLSAIAYSARNKAVAMGRRVKDGTDTQKSLDRSIRANVAMNRAVKKGVRWERKREFCERLSAEVGKALIIRKRASQSIPSSNEIPRIEKLRSKQLECESLTTKLCALLSSALQTRRHVSECDEGIRATRQQIKKEFQECPLCGNPLR
jgi:hypothetical protein